MLLALLERVHTGSRWHSLRSALAGVTEAQAAWRPADYRGFPFLDGSIAGLVFHVGGDHLFTISQCFGDGALTWERLEARWNQAGRALAAARTLLDEGHRPMRAQLTAMSDADLAQSTTLGERTMRNHELFALLIEHAAYHAGQIRYVRNLLEGQTQASHEA